MNIAVVGAGVFGISSALELRRRRHHVTVFERGDVPCELASSYDVSKAVRRDGYFDELLELVERAESQWSTWNDQLGRNIYVSTSRFHIVSKEEPEIVERWELLSQIRSGVERLSRSQVAEQLPQFSLDDRDQHFFRDRWGGYLRSTQAVRDLASLAENLGVKIRPQVEVLAVEESNRSVCLTFDNAPDRSAEFDRVVVAAGPWVGRLVPALANATRITQQEYAFFRPTDPRPFKPDVFPVWCIHPTKQAWYGFPLLREGVVKLAYDQLGDEVEPDCDRSASPRFLESVADLVDRRFPQLNSTDLVDSSSCLYTNTDDARFVVDWVPGLQRVAVAGCGNGHGFKFGGSIGLVVADHVEDCPNPLGEPFRLRDRFE